MPCAPLPHSLRVDSLNGTNDAIDRITLKQLRAGILERCFPGRLTTPYVALIDCTGLVRPAKESRGEHSGTLEVSWMEPGETSPAAADRRKASSRWPALDSSDGPPLKPRLSFAGLTKPMGHDALTAYRGCWIGRHPARMCGRDGREYLARAAQFASSVVWRLVSPGYATTELCDCESWHGMVQDRPERAAPSPRAWINGKEASLSAT
jgi:hypothetical protein